MSSSAKALQVPCPTCARRTVFAPANRWRPFCSERCRSIDLGAWASESFRVTADPQPEDIDGAGPASPESRPPGG
ncbi:MAG TPA: DNA gyrase inhibitor YacG [Burkholderiaceae bacterium]